MFGFKVYYGDGTRAGRAARRRRRHAREPSWSASTSATPPTRIVELVKAEFPQAKLLVRAFDREHVLRADRKPASTTRSAKPSNPRWSSASAASCSISASRNPKPTRPSSKPCKKRDEEAPRKWQIAGGLRAGLVAHARQRRHHLQPAPLVVPREKAKPLNEEAVEVIKE